MTNSTESQLAAALARVDELERALMVFEAMSPEERMFEAMASAAGNELMAANGRADKAETELQRIADSRSDLRRKLDSAESAMEAMTRAASKEEVDWIRNKYLGHSQPVSTYDPYGSPKHGPTRPRDFGQQTERIVYNPLRWNRYE